MTSFTNLCFSSGRQRMENYVKMLGWKRAAPSLRLWFSASGVRRARSELGWVTVSSGEVPSHICRNMDALLVCCEEEGAKRESEATLFTYRRIYIPTLTWGYELWLINGYEILPKDVKDLL